MVYFCEEPLLLIQLNRFPYTSNPRLNAAAIRLLRTSKLEDKAYYFGFANFSTSIDRGEGGRLNWQKTIRKMNFATILCSSMLKSFKSLGLKICLKFHLLSMKNLFFAFSSLEDPQLSREDHVCCDRIDLCSCQEAGFLLQLVRPAAF